MGAVALATSAGAASGAGDATAGLSEILQRAGARVEQYFVRAQSIICLETVHVQPLGQSLSPDGFGRSVESELWLSWDARQPEASTETRVRRQVVRVNGQPPRRNDPNNCTVPEQLETETPALAMLLPDQQSDYEFSLAPSAVIDRRRAIVLAYREKARPQVSVQSIAGRDDCVTFEVNGGFRGRIWIDAETDDVLRLDQGLIGLVDIAVPWVLARRGGSVTVWTVERFDTSTRFRSVVFDDPQETLMLPVSVSVLQITRGAGQPRQRTTTEYTRYKRFLTGGRVVKE